MRNTIPEREFVFFDETGSTNDDMKKTLYESDTAIYSVISAEKQTSGRGRLGRAFLSPNGGIYFSVSYPLTGGERNIPFLTLVAGLAVAECISESADERTRNAVKIKWPNDIYIGGKKVCGILTELIKNGERLTAIVGIGINSETIPENCSEELKSRITSLSREGIFADKKTLMRAITEKLDGYVYERRALDGDVTELVERINNLSFLVEKKVGYTAKGEEKRGIVEGVEADGALRVRTKDGAEGISFGEVIVI